MLISVENSYIHFYIQKTGFYFILPFFLYDFFMPLAGMPGKSKEEELVVSSETLLKT